MIEAIKNRLPFWASLSGRERSLLAASLSRQVYGAGERLPLGPAACLGVLFVESGLLRVYLLSPEGREVTLYRVQPGEFCVLSASCILEHISFEVQMQAEEQSRVISLSAAALSTLSAASPLVENFIYKNSAERFSDVMWAMQQILFISFDKRLAGFLLDESARTGSPELKMTQEQIARQTGSAREVVSRMLKYFAAEGLAAPFRGGVRITDKAGLKALAG